jgi:hypothetical protein
MYSCIDDAHLAGFGTQRVLDVLPLKIVESVGAFLVKKN